MNWLTPDWITALIVIAGVIATIVIHHYKVGVHHKIIFDDNGVVRLRTVEDCSDIEEEKQSRFCKKLDKIERQISEMEEKRDQARQEQEKRREVDDERWRKISVHMAVTRKIIENTKAES